MNIERDLRSLLYEIDLDLRNSCSAEHHATLLIAKANVLIALQKYEKEVK